MTAAQAAQVRALWGAGWLMLTAEHPDAEARLARLPHAGKVARLEASAARRGARVVRGELPLSDFVERLREWENAAADALATLDTERSANTCGDCGDNATETVAAGGLAHGRVCRTCLREAAPMSATSRPTARI